MEWASLLGTLKLLFKANQKNFIIQLAKKGYDVQISVKIRWNVYMLFISKRIDKVFKILYDNYWGIHHFSYYDMWYKIY